MAVLNVHSGHGVGRPVLCPADGEKDVPLAYHPGEGSEPIPESKTKKAGYPISVTFPAGTVVGDTDGKLTDADGNEMAV